MLGRFISADTVTLGGTQGLNRYAYIGNNPVNSIDPSGHKCIDVDPENQSSGCSIGSDGGIAASIQSDYGITISGNYKRFEAQVILKSLKLMEAGLDYLTGGYGNDWMQNNLNGVNIHIGDDLATTAVQDADPTHSEHNVTIGSTVNLVSNLEDYSWQSPDFRVDTMIIHELGHVVDDRSSFLGMADLTGGGLGDALLSFVGGKANSIFRFLPNSLSIPPKNAFQPGNGWDYGNSAPAEYFAQVFSGTIYKPNDPHLPRAASLWMIAYLNLTK